MLKLQLLLTACLMFAATQSLWADDEQKLLFQYGFGPLFTSPTAVNNQIDKSNTALQNAGFKNYSLPRFGTIWGSSAFVGYRFSKFWDAGISFSSYKQELSATDTLRGLKYTDTVNGGFQSWRAKAFYHFVRANPWSIYVAPAAGISTYSFDETATLGSDTASATASNTAFSAVVGFGAEYKMNKYLSTSLETGYTYARSGALKIDSQSNSSYSAGQTVKWSGTDAIVDASGLYITAALTLHLSAPTQQEIKNDVQMNHSAESAPPPTPAQQDALPEVAPVKEEPPPPEKSDMKNFDDSIEEKLNRIKNLRDRGIITEKEYESMRREILEKIL